MVVLGLKLYHAECQPCNENTAVSYLDILAQVHRVVQRPAFAEQRARFGQQGAHHYHPSGDLSIVSIAKMLSPEQVVAGEII